MSELDDGRMPEDGLSTTADVVLSQNGTIRPAPASVTYGTQPPGTVLGEVYPFTREESGVTVNYVCALIDVSSTVKVYYQKDGGAWTACGGSNSFNTTDEARFAQIKGMVLVASKGTEMCWMDTSDFTIVKQTALSTPTAPTVAQTGMAGTAFTHYYKVTAVNVGESAASTAGSVQSTKPRDQWDGTTTYCTLTLTRVTGAVGYNVYYTSVSGGDAELITFIPDPGSGTTFAWVDNNAIVPDITRVAPAVDTSKLPKVTHVRILNDRVYAWGDTDDKWKIWYGGTLNDTKLKFSSWYGGGYTRIGNGTAYTPNSVTMYRTGKGDPAITVFCRSQAGMGKRYILAENTITEGDTVITVMGAQEDNGAWGSDSPDGIVMAEDDIFYPSKDSFKKTGNKVNVPNILSSKGITDGIQTDVRALNANYMHKCVGLYYQGVIYWAVPYGTTTENNQIWSLDITRGGAWMLPINVAATWMWLYDDSDGETHFCYLTPDSEILEFTRSQATVRNGVPFSTAITSGLLKFSDDGQEWANVEKIKFVLIRPQGYITASVTGKTEDAPVAEVGASTFTPTTSITGIGEEAIGDYYIGEVRNAPIEYGSNREEVEIDVDEEVQWLQWSIRSSGANVDYELSDAIIYFVNVGVKD